MGNIKKEIDYMLYGGFDFFMSTHQCLEYLEKRLKKGVKKGKTKKKKKKGGKR